MKASSAVDSRQLRILSAICDLPTAPYCEQHVIRWLFDWARLHGRHISARQDKAGNVYLEYRRGRARKNPLVIEAHMDHPGFVAQRQRRDGSVDAIFRGGVKPSHFKKARMRFWCADEEQAILRRAEDGVASLKSKNTKDALPAPAVGRWVAAKVLGAKPVRNQRHLHVRLAPVKEKIPTGTLGMWDLPEAAVGKGLFAARVCDDLAGVAAIVCMLEALIARKAEAHVIGMCSRAEEVGFAGVLAACEHGWMPRGSPVIGLETSKAFAYAPQGGGPIIRVGDRTGIFSAGLTHFLAQTAARIGDDDAAFRFQRKLMDGGTCNTTACFAYGYDAAGICVALGNYHNMSIRGEIGWKAGVGGTAGRGIASETIHVGDFVGMVRLLVEACGRIGEYVPGFGVVRERLAAMHRKEQKELLYGTARF